MLPAFYQKSWPVQLACTVLDQSVVMLAPFHFIRIGCYFLQGLGADRYIFASESFIASDFKTTGCMIILIFIGNKSHSYENVGRTNNR